MPAPAPESRTGAVASQGTSHLDRVRCQRWTSDGAVRVDGDVDVDAAELRGVVVVGGSVTGGDVSVLGALDVGSAIRLTGRLSVDGRASLKGALAAREVVLKGTTIAPGSLTVAERLAAEGKGEIGGAVTAGVVDLSGHWTVPGPLTSRGDVDLRLRDGSTIGHVQGKSIRLSRTGRPFGRGWAPEVESAEGSEVSVEGVRCRYVRADRIVLLGRAHVYVAEGTVERRSPSARVGPESATPPPKGLSR